MYDEIKTLLVDELGVEEDMVTPNANLKNDLNANSMTLLNVVLAIEDEFGVSMEEDRLRTLSTVEDLVDYTQSLTA